MFDKLYTQCNDSLDLPFGSKEKAVLIAETAFAKKARNIMILELENLTIISDFFVICTADSSPQIKAIVDDVEERLLGTLGMKPLGIDGQSYDRWVVMDYGDVIFHVFDEEKRNFYELEKLWLDAPRIALPFTE
ncbi:MAG TPA: ribosome silencing factor [Thermodesulfovibrionia bacterium]|nr:ribosome silencing factor [Thermodesulfovibrionia bacterium]